MRKSDVTNWLFDEIATYLDNTSLVSVSTPTDHVDEAQFHDGHIYPFVGVQPIAATPESAGIGSGEIFVDELTYGPDGILQSITRRRDVTLRVSIIPTTDENPKRRDDLGEDLTDHFAVLARTGDYPDDIDDVSVDEATAQNRGDDFVAADGIPVEIEYSRYIVDNDPDVAESVNVDVDVGDDVSVDAFDETFN